MTQPENGAPPEPAPVPCGQPTHNGTPCQLRALAGGGGRCHQHANLPPTAAQQEAARRNPVKNGLFARSRAGNDEKRIVEEIEADLANIAGLKVQRYWAAALRADQLTKWESDRGVPSPVATAAFAAYSRALDALPEDGAAHECLDPAAIQAYVDELLKDPE